MRLPIFTPQTISARRTAAPLKLGALGVAALALFEFGCACPHRKAETIHTVEHFCGRPDGLVEREVSRDIEGGGGIFIFTDPTVQSMAALHTNQSSLGGGSVFSTGPMSAVVDSNLSPAVAATGTAVGNILKAAVK